MRIPLAAAAVALLAGGALADDVTLFWKASTPDPVPGAANTTGDVEKGGFERKSGMVSHPDRNAAATWIDGGGSPAITAAGATPIRLFLRNSNKDLAVDFTLTCEVEGKQQVVLKTRVAPFESGWVTDSYRAACEGQPACKGTGVLDAYPDDFACEGQRQGASWNGAKGGLLDPNRANREAHVCLDFTRFYKMGFSPTIPCRITTGWPVGNIDYKPGYPSTLTIQ